MNLSRRRLKAGAAFSLLALAVELTGRTLTARLDAVRPKLIRGADGRAERVELPDGRVIDFP